MGWAPRRPAQSADRKAKRARCITLTHTNCTMVQMPNSEIARLIDHTLLKPEATLDQIAKLCDEARECGFASVCINPFWVPVAFQSLTGTSVKTCTVIGFPLGAGTTQAKVFEARNAVRSGAQEIDMVMNIGALRSCEPGVVLADIRGRSE